MKIYNQEKTKELKNCDLNKGYLLLDSILIEIKPAVEGLRGELEVYEDIQVYIEYTEKELEKKLEELKLLKIKEIKDKTAEVILAKYSITTQNNIRELRINTATKNKYTQNDKDEMLDWIDKIRLQGIEFQENVNKINTIDEYNVYSYEFKI
jgi:hypothetical protein